MGIGVAERTRGSIGIMWMHQYVKKEKTWEACEKVAWFAA